METSYLKMVSESRISNYLGLKMDEGTHYSHAKCAESDYAYIEIPIRCLTPSSAGDEQSELIYGGKKGQHFFVTPAAIVNVKGRSIRFEIHPNPVFWEYGICQGMYYLEPGSGFISPGFHIHLKKDLDLTLTNFEYCVRIYMRQ